MILVSGYLVMVAVNWPWNVSPISNCIDVSCIHTSHHLARLCCLINILRDYIWAMIWSCDSGQRFSCLLFLVDPIITKPACRGPLVCATPPVPSSKTVRRHPRAIPLAMLTMKIETIGFHIFYAWFSYVSPISIGMGLRSPALRAGEARY